MERWGGGGRGARDLLPGLSWTICGLTLIEKGLRSWTILDHTGLEQWGILTRADLVEPSLFEQPILMSALAPFAKVAGIEILASVAEALDDVGIREAVEDPAGDLVAGGFGEASDFS